MNARTHPTRDYSLDNIRCILIFLVVFAHLLEVCSPFTGSWLIYRFIYSFHMPAFLFLFGYNIYYSPKKLISRWCIPYVLFQCIYLVFAVAILKADLNFQFTTPYWLLWYMLACIYYQLLLPLFDTDNKRKQIINILCVYLVSLLIGIDDSVGYYMSLSRFFVFQPWFLLGYYCKKNNFIDKMSFNSKNRFMLSFISVLIICCLLPCLFTIPNGLLYGSYSYSKCSGAMWMRIVISFMALSMIGLLFVGLKQHFGKKIILITTIGQNTLPVFLLHGFFVKAVPVYFPHLVSSPLRVVLLSCSILILLGNKLCRNAVSFMCFSWVEKHTMNTKKQRIGQ